MYRIGPAIMRAMVMRAAPNMRACGAGLLCRSADLVGAIFARANANIMALTEADRSLSPKLLSAERVEKLFVLFAAPSVKQPPFIMRRIALAGFPSRRPRSGVLSAYFWRTILPDWQPRLPG
jgi:hypothetical protein